MSETNSSNPRHVRQSRQSNKTFVKKKSKREQKPMSPGRRRANERNVPMWALESAVTDVVIVPAPAAAAAAAATVVVTPHKTADTGSVILGEPSGSSIPPKASKQGPSSSRTKKRKTVTDIESLSGCSNHEQNHSVPPVASSFEIMDPVTLQELYNEFKNDLGRGLLETVQGEGLVSMVDPLQNIDTIHPITRRPLLYAVVRDFVEHVDENAKSRRCHVGIIFDEMETEQRAKRQRVIPFLWGKYGDQKKGESTQPLAPKRRTGERNVHSKTLENGKAHISANKLIKEDTSQTASIPHKQTHVETIHSERDMCHGGEVPVKRTTQRNAKLNAINAIAIQSITDKFDKEDIDIMANSQRPNTTNTIPKTVASKMPENGKAHKVTKKTVREDASQASSICQTSGLKKRTHEQTVNAKREKCGLGQTLVQRKTRRRRSTRNSANTEAFQSSIDESDDKDVEVSHSRSNTDLDVSRGTCTDEALIPATPLKNQGPDTKLKMNVDHMCAHLPTTVSEFVVRPSFQKEEPESIQQLYDEYNGLGDYQDVPIKGGFHIYMTHVFKKLSGSIYPQYRVARDISKWINESIESNNKLASEVIAELEQARKADMGSVFEFCWQHCGREGKRPNVSDNSSNRKRKKARPPSRPVVLLESDPNDSYTEETAFLYHNPVAKGAFEEPEKLHALPKPLDVPSIPSSLSPRWRFDSDQPRIIYADFSSCVSVPPEDAIFLRQMMQRDDIVVIIDGLVSLGDKWEEFLEVEAGFEGNVYHKFRRFELADDLNGRCRVTELDDFLSLSMDEYCRYLERFSDISIAKAEGRNEDARFDVNLADGKLLRLDDVTRHILYMVDVEMKTHLPRLDESFKRSMKLSQILPEGEWCMMNSVTRGSLPFMGPNLYVTPPGSFTQFHQDGFGTVDSLHFCYSGYNEIVILRRLPTRHKQNVNAILNRNKGKEAQKGRGLSASSYDALHTFPHGDTADGQGDKPDWPTKTSIQQMQEMNYCPVVTILKPGQAIHIGKGRLHAFRKLRTEHLPEDDCHFDLRNNLVKTHDLQVSPLCVSIAYDWMFLGHDADGINREISSILESAYICQQQETKRLVLAPIETALLSLARYLAKRLDKTVRAIRIFRPSSGDCVNLAIGNLELCRGILPTLRCLVDRMQGECKQQNKRRHITFPVTPTMEMKREEQAQDVWCNDYFCKLCMKELSNVIYTCVGCERLLNQDFNICSECYQGKKDATTYLMSQCTDLPIWSTFHHTGDMAGGKCQCREGMLQCACCQGCSRCSCSCHTHFRAQFRRAALDELKDYVSKVETYVGNDEIHYAKETELRLKLSHNQIGTAFDELIDYVKDMPRNKAKIQSG